MAIKSSPLIAQYLSVKQKVPDAILFFRLGDFYEMMFEDAEVGARVLDIQLTSRSKDGVPLCGVPYHSAEPYIAKLLKAGLKVAICEQTQPEPRPRAPGAARVSGKASGSSEPFQLTPQRGLMPRQIVRVITPGTVSEETVLASGEKSFLLALAASASGEGGFALAAVDVSTGEFLATRIAGAAGVREEIARIAPREIIASRGDSALAALLEGVECPVSWLDGAAFDAQRSREALAARFGAEAAGALAETVTVAAGAALIYVEQTFGRELAHLRPPHPYRAAEYMLVDEVSRRHLELVVSSDGTRRGSLLAVLDESLTPVGARALQKWIVYPLLDLEAICARHDAVEELFETDLGGEVADALRRIGDLERLAGRIGSLRASPRDCLRLEQALRAVGALRAALQRCKSALIRELAARIVPMPELAERIDATLSDEPPVNPRDGNVIRTGFNAEVDELRSLASDARGVIAELEATERARSNIPSLKVRYNQVFGYYIEVTRPNLDRVPADYERKQTLVGAERFTTPALKELERKILGAESGLKELELGLFTTLVGDLALHAGPILATAAAVGEFDALLALAAVARRRGYVRPRMNSGLALSVRDGRHPVLEAAMRAGEFVPNDLQTDPDERQLLLITGPNMAGKSTYLRQVALIVIMAQMGSFVPATEAELGLVDRVLTRIGARDDLRRGESTFMVEMRETSRLLMGLDQRSLLLLDEVGRGTSTFDGLAIAWALAEHLHDNTRAKVLFATHFHELTDLARERRRVKNLSMAVREWEGEVLFLRRVIEQPASRSYGIEVARLAGLPETVVARARQILANLEMGELDEAGQARLAHRPDPEGGGAGQLGLFTPAERRVVDELKTLEVERLTPIEALNALARAVGRLRQGEG
ncbi:MAG TPA: DNA mismatch repair protein MutS [Candidatus Binataceae bacterium]|nr:DNA mismatch repair protein MutS [Candidatus Binataceae bacterium]